MTGCYITFQGNHGDLNEQELLALERVLNKEMPNTFFRVEHDFQIGGIFDASSIFHDGDRLRDIESHNETGFNYLDIILQLQQIGFIYNQDECFLKSRIPLSGLSM